MRMSLDSYKTAQKVKVKTLSNFRKQEMSFDQQEVSFQDKTEQDVTGLAIKNSYVAQSNEGFRINTEE